MDVDSDGDGYSDYDANWPAHPVGSADAFPLVATQWNDTDADGYGDESTGYNPDMCVTTNGNSSQDRHGCPDTDGDGYSDPDPLGNNGSVWTVGDGADVWPNEPTQWADSDTDGYGDNPAGVFPDHALLSTETQLDRYGCTDTDGTPIETQIPALQHNGADTHANDPLRWSDEDGDGFDNQIDTVHCIGAIQPSIVRDAPIPMAMVFRILTRIGHQPTTALMLSRPTRLNRQILMGMGLVTMLQAT